MLHATSHERDIRAKAVSLVTRPNDRLVLLYFEDGSRLALPRPLLQAAGGPLSTLPGVRINAVIVSSMVLYDDTPLAFTMVARFLACAPVDLSAPRAPLVAASAARWHVHALLAACYAAAEVPDVRIQHHRRYLTLCSFPDALAAWLPILSPNCCKADIKPPPRFMALLARRTALALHLLMPLVRSCHMCNPAADAPLIEYDALSCALCAGLPQQDHIGLWHVLYRAGILSHVIRIGCRAFGMSIARDLLRVVVHRLKHEMPTRDAVRLLCNAGWAGGWARVIDAMSTEEKEAIDARGWQVISQVLTAGMCNTIEKGITFGSASVNVDRVSTGGVDGRRGVSAVGDIFGSSRVHLAVVWTSAAHNKSSVSDDSSAVPACALRASVRLEKVGPKNAESDEDDPASPTAENEAKGENVTVIIEAFAAGCPCELGCMLQTGQRGRRVLMGDRKRAVLTTWGDMFSAHGVQVNVLNQSEFKDWTAQHDDSCGLVLSARVGLAGAIDSPHMAASTAVDVTGGSPAGKTIDMVCACNKCRRI